MPTPNGNITTSEIWNTPESQVEGEELELIEEEAEKEEE